MGYQVVGPGYAVFPRTRTASNENDVSPSHIPIIKAIKGFVINTRLCEDKTYLFSELYAKNHEVSASEKLFEE